MTKPSARLVLVVILLSMACPLAAESRASVICGDLPTGSEQKQCAMREYQAALALLNDTYEGALAYALKADAQHPDSKRPGDKGWAAAISESQRAWEIYRDAECWGVVGRADGSGRMVWVRGCQVEKIRERIKELNVPFYQR